MWICPRCETFNQNSDTKCYICFCEYSVFLQTENEKAARAAAEKAEKAKAAAESSKKQKQEEPKKHIPAAAEKSDDKKDVDALSEKYVLEKGKKLKKSTTKENIKRCVRYAMAALAIIYLIWMIYYWGREIIVGAAYLNKNSVPAYSSACIDTGADENNVPEVFDISFEVPILQQYYLQL